MTFHSTDILMYQHSLRQASWKRCRGYMGQKEFVPIKSIKSKSPPPPPLHPFSLRSTTVSHPSSPPSSSSSYRVIADKQHIHMNATKWESLTTFVKYLGKQGTAIVDETEKVRLSYLYIAATQGKRS